MSMSANRKPGLPDYFITILNLADKLQDVNQKIDQVLVIMKPRCDAPGKYSWCAASIAFSRQQEIAELLSYFDKEIDVFKQI